MIDTYFHFLKFSPMECWPGTFLRVYKKTKFKISLDFLFFKKICYNKFMLTIRSA